MSCNSFIIWKTLIKGFNWKIIQLLIWSSHPVNGSLKIELCETEIENSSNDVLVLEYQAWFEMYGSREHNMHHIPIVFKSIQAHSRSSDYSTERKLYSGRGLNWFLNPSSLIGDRISLINFWLINRILNTGFFQKTSFRFYHDKRPKDQFKNIYRQKRKPWLNMIACQLMQIFLLPRLSTWMTIVLLNHLQSKKESN